MRWQLKSVKIKYYYSTMETSSQVQRLPSNWSKSFCRGFWGSRMDLAALFWRIWRFSIRAELFWSPQTVSPLSNKERKRLVYSLPRKRSFACHACRRLQFIMQTIEPAKFLVQLFTTWISRLVRIPPPHFLFGWEYFWRLWSAILKLSLAGWQVGCDFVGYSRW